MTQEAYFVHNETSCGPFAYFTKIRSFDLDEGHRTPMGQLGVIGSCGCSINLIILKLRI